MIYNISNISGCGGTGRRKGLKIPRSCSVPVRIRSPAPESMFEGVRRDFNPKPSYLPLMKREYMKNLHIVDSYKIWDISKMKSIILSMLCPLDPEVYLNRTFRSMYIEWWLHNIGYYITKPFCNNPKMAHYNMRCKDVDLEEH